MVTEMLMDGSAVALGMRTAHPLSFISSYSAGDVWAGAGCQQRSTR